MSEARCNRRLGTPASMVLEQAGETTAKPRCWLGGMLLA